MMYFFHHFNNVVIINDVTSAKFLQCAISPLQRLYCFFVFVRILHQHKLQAIHPHQIHQVKLLSQVIMVN